MYFRQTKPHLNFSVTLLRRHKLLTKPSRQFPPYCLMGPISGVSRRVGGGATAAMSVRRVHAEFSTAGIKG